jgi:hypothetical protein
MKTRNPPVLITLAVVCFALFPKAQGVLPPPDGGYPNFTTAEGTNALKNLTTGAANTGVGWYSLFSASTASYNTGVGAGTLALNTADGNTATGTAALLLNSTGHDNTANGFQALFSNNAGNQNTALGAQALFHNTADNNCAVGFKALMGNATGIENTATGVVALFSNFTGDGNTATGQAALFLNTQGDGNTATGQEALVLSTGNFNTADGVSALANNTTGSGNTALGVFAGTGITTADNVIAIAAAGQNVSNSCYIGMIYSNVQPIVGTDPDSVTITSSGRLGRGNVSSRRYKHDIKPMEKASEVLYALKPVSFRYNKEYDATQTLAFGLIAEEVAEVYPDLVGRNPQGDAESVRYEQINAMLLNEFLKEHRRVEELKSAMTQQRKETEVLVARLNEQEARIQKVSAQLEASKPAPQVAENNR